MADALLTVEGLTKSFGDKLLFEDISFGINAGQKSALIARNGYGKSTLLNIIMTAAGQKGYNTLQDAGKITFRGDLKLAYLPQSPEAYPKQIVRDFVYNVQRPETEDEWTFEQRMEEILSRIHPSTSIGDYNGAPTLGDNVYIGPGAKLYGPITIGDNVAIGANAVVNNSFPSNCTVGGIPARVLSDTGALEQGVFPPTT